MNVTKKGLPTSGFGGGVLCGRSGGGEKRMAYAKNGAIGGSGEVGG